MSANKTFICKRLLTKLDDIGTNFKLVNIYCQQIIHYCFLGSRWIAGPPHVVTIFG